MAGTPQGTALGRTLAEDRIGTGQGPALGPVVADRAMLIVGADGASGRTLEELAMAEKKTVVYGSVAELEQALRDAAIAHGKHEERLGRYDENWPAWYAQYMAQSAGSADNG